MEQFSVTPVDPPPKKRSKVPFIVLGALLLIATGVTVFAGSRYFAAQSQLTKLTTDNAKLTKQNQILTQEAKADTSQAETDASAPKSAADLMRVYQALQSQAVSTTDGDDDAIYDALQKYYKVDELPVGADILIVYQVVKPQTPPSGELHALVYWPKSDSKPAGFIDMIRPAGAIEWQYNDML